MYYKTKFLTSFLVFLFSSIASPHLLMRCINQVIYPNANVTFTKFGYGGSPRAYFLKRTINIKRGFVLRHNSTHPYILTFISSLTPLFYILVKTLLCGIGLKNLPNVASFCEKCLQHTSSYQFYF